MHWRDPAKVASGGGLYQVMPVGMFQPSHGAPWNVANDFDLWRGFARELSEELLGSTEDYGSDTEPIDYATWPFFNALTKAAALLRPGGCLVVVGLARNATLADWLISALCLPVTRLHDFRPSFGRPDGMPVADAALSWGEVRKRARELLPGARYQHHLHYRYSLRWTKPAHGGITATV